MGVTTGIEWTQHTWNPWRGCTKISPGCANCYMFTEQRRYGRDPTQVVRTKTWGDPLKWQKAAQAAGRTELVFTCSWSDWFHERADAWRDEAWDVVRRCPHLIFQILTKRPERWRKCWPLVSVPGHVSQNEGDGKTWERFPNVWLGVSVEDQQRADERIPLLLQVPAAVRFLSIEPLLGPVNLRRWLEDLNTGSILEDCIKVDWVIAGGESGARSRPCDVAWIRSVVRQCQAASVPCFVKQLGSRPIARATVEPGYSGEADARVLRDPKGGDPEEWPEDLRIRQFPQQKGSP